MLVTLVRDSLTVVFLLGYLFYPELAAHADRRGAAAGHRLASRQDQSPAAAAGTASIRLLTNELSYIVEETVGGYKVVKVHNGEKYEMDRFSSMSKRLRGYAMRMTVSGGLAQPLTQFLASIALAVVITIAVVQSSSDQTTVGGFVAFVTSMLLIISPLKHLMDVNQPLQRVMTAAELIFGLIDEPAEPAGGGKPLERARGEVEFRDVSFMYSANATHNRHTLDKVSFKVAPGEMVALARSVGQRQDHAG